MLEFLRFRRRMNVRDGGSVYVSADGVALLASCIRGAVLWVIKILCLRSSPRASCFLLQVLFLPACTGKLRSGLCCRAPLRRRRLSLEPTWLPPLSFSPKPADGWFSSSAQNPFPFIIFKLPRMPYVGSQRTNSVASRSRFFCTVRRFSVRA